MKRALLFLVASGVTAAIASADPIIVTGGMGYEQITFADRASFNSYFSVVPGVSFVNVDLESANSTGGTYTTQMNNGVSISDTVLLPVTKPGSWQIQGGTTWVSTMYADEQMNIAVANKVVLGMIATFDLPEITSGVEVSSGQLAPAGVPSTPRDSFYGDAGVAFFPNDATINPELENTAGMYMMDGTLSGLDSEPPQPYEMWNIELAVADAPPVAAAPEPASWGLLAVAGAALGLMGWRRKRQEQ